MVSSIKRDLLFALRMLLKTPVVTVIAVISLAIGVAANTTVFSIVHAWLLRPLPYPEADRLVMVWANPLLETDNQNLVTPADFFDWKTESTAFDAWIAWRYRPANLTGIERPEQVTVADVTPNYFDLLDARPMMGRTFGEDEGGAADGPALVMGETIWRTRFGGAPEMVGSTVTLDGTRYTVLGVMPETFDFLLGNVSMWTATDLHTERFDRASHNLMVTARLAPGVSRERAQSEMSAVASRLADLHPDTNRDWGVNIEPVRELFPGPTDRGLIRILMAVVLLVLLIACVNVSSLLMAKSDARQREISIRISLGAGRVRLINQLLTESVLLALIAGATGVALAVLGIDATRAAMPPEMPQFFHPKLNASVVGFTVGISVLAGLVFGITPAFHAVGGTRSAALVDGSRGGTASRQRSRLRAAFVVAEFALALTILLGTGVLTDLFHQRLAIDPGFNAANLVKAELQLPEYKYPDDESVHRFTVELERELETVRGAVGFTLTNVLPRSRTIPRSDFTIDGEEYEPNEVPSTAWLSVGTNYFDVMGIPVRSGRVFDQRDRDDTAPVAVVNRRWAARHFAGRSPVGQHITIRGESCEIVGVVDNIAQMRLTGLEPHEATVYFPMTQQPVRNMMIMLRAEADPNRLILPLQEAVWAVDADVPVARTQPLQAYMRSQLAGPIVMTQILVIIGILTLALAATGIYGVMAYSVSQRTREIGIRMALGATSHQVLRRVTRQGVTLAGAGLLAGVPFAALALMTINRIFERAGSFEGIQSASPVIAVSPIFAVGAILVAVGLLASFLPARRATKVDPLTALGVE